MTFRIVCVVNAAWAIETISVAGIIEAGMVEWVVGRRGV
jgi:hypothetical protein